MPRRTSDTLGARLYWGPPPASHAQRILSAVAVVAGCALGALVAAQGHRSTAAWGLGLALLGMAALMVPLRWPGSGSRWLRHLAGACFAVAVPLAVTGAGGAGSGLGILYVALAAYAHYTYGARSVAAVLCLAALQLLPGLAQPAGGIAAHVVIDLLITAAWIPLGARGHALHIQARQQARYLAAVEATGVILAKLDLDDTLAATAEQVIAATGADQCVIFLADQELQTLRPRVVRLDPGLYQPADQQAWQRLVVHYGDGMVGWVAVHQQPILTGDAERDPRAKHVPGTVFADESALLVPMVAEDRLVGVIRATRQGLNQFLPEDLRLLQVLGAGAAVAIAHARLYQEARRQAVTDPLTGLYNRHYFNTRIQPQLAQDSVANTQFAALMIDLYEFKQVNDTWGHAIGDRVLRRVAELIRDHVRGTDIVVRYGGDEFVVIMPQTGRAEAGRVRRRIQAAVEAHNRALPPDQPRVHLSMGVAAAPGGDLSQLLSRADAAMYAAKRRQDRRRAERPDRADNPG